MKAAVLTNWNNIELTDVDIPQAGANEAVIRVSFAGICGSDVQIFHGRNPIAKTPVIPGHEFAGHIHSLGAGANQNLSVGQQVAVRPFISCGSCTACCHGLNHVCENLIVIGVNQNGAFAEYVRVPVDNLVPLPDAVPATIAALSEPFSVGYHTCRRGKLEASDRVLVTGAGPIGLYAAIVARELGARDVVISEPLAQRRTQVEKLGFAAFDPNTMDGEEALRVRSDGKGYDLIIETSGVDAGFDTAVRTAAVRGRIVTLGFPHKNYAAYNVTQGIVKELSLIGSRVCPPMEFEETLQLISYIYQSDRLDFEEIIAEIRPLEQIRQSIDDTAHGRLRGKILIEAG